MEVREEGAHTPAGTACTATRQRRAPDHYFLSLCLSHFPRLSRLSHLSAVPSQPLEETFDQTVLHERIKNFSRNAVAHW